MSILDPTSGSTGTGHLSDRLETLDDKVVGIIWNGRRPGPGEGFLLDVAERLKTRYRVKGILFKTKPLIGNVAPEEILTFMAVRAHAVITGVGD
jgi:hypothetical protein